MDDQQTEILIHRIVGSWAIDQRVLMTPHALEQIETRLMTLLADVRQQERERCLDAIAGLYHADAARAVIRSLE